MVAETQAGVVPEQILFVENSPMHIDAARARGWQTLLYDPVDADSSNDHLVSRLTQSRCSYPYLVIDN